MPRPDQEFKGEFWADRGIDPKVARERGYLRYEKNDIGTVRGHFASLSAGQKATVTRKLTSEHGIAIPRFAVLEGKEKPVPELRPDVAISTETPRSHWHGFGEPPKHETHYRKLDPTGVAGLAHRWKWHTPPEGKVTSENEAARERGEEPGNTEDVHENRSPGKYHFAPTGYVDVEKIHDHDEQYKLPKIPQERGKYSNYLSPEQRRARHVAKHHDGVDVVGEHEHVWKIKNPNENHARRLDIHPGASERLEAARLVYFGIEGCLKADAILSAILKEDRPESVFSVPSVSLWEAPELAEFIEQRLVGKVVIIVSDADWIKKHQVIEQACMCRTYLRRQGLEAHVAAPPTDRLDEGIKGVDDYLGQGGGTLDGLMVQERAVDECKHLEWLAARHIRRDRRARDAITLYGLAAHANDEGEYHGAIAKLARVMGVERRRVERAIHGLEEIGAIEITGDLAVRKGWFTHGPDWVGPNPVIRLIPELRGEDLPEYPLGELVVRLEVRQTAQERLEKRRVVS